METHPLPAVCAFWLFATSAAHAAIHYVDVNSANPTPPYTSWATAATNIQDAVQFESFAEAFARLLAGRYDEEIVVTNGVYSTGTGGGGGTRVYVSLPMKLRSVNGPQFTVIEGYRNTRNPNFGIRCVYLGSGASLSGFTLTNGSTIENPNIPVPGDGYRGGGVLCRSTSSVVTNCVIVGNSAAWAGGGAYGGTLINCVLTNNSAYVGGGAGGYSETGPRTVCKLINCLVTGNSASEGGGAYGGEGGLTEYCILVNCVLTNNYAGFIGGGATGCSLERCRLVGNSREGAFFCRLNNCTIMDHTVGAELCSLVNCTITRNYIGDDGGYLRNCAVYDNSNANYQAGSSFEYCYTTPLPETGEGNTLSGNLVDAGNSAYVTTATDLAGRPRIVGARVDIGAYEFVEPFNNWLRLYDLPTDGSADFTDPDGDGLNNYQESVTGTVPTDAMSALRLLTSTPGSSGAIVTWESVANKWYFLERSANLGTSPAFSTIQSSIPGQPGTTSYTDTNAVGPGPFFYRVGVQQ